MNDDAQQQRPRPPRPETAAVHVSPPQIPVSSPAGVPLHQNHVFTFDTLDDLVAAFGSHGETFMYGRYGNPTVRALEDAIAGLEGGAVALASSSGMGTISATLSALLRPGDHVVALRRLYGGTTAYLDRLRERWGIEVDYVSGDDPDEVRAALRPTTRVLYLETITNPTCQVIDLPTMFAIARQAGVKSVVDNTFATPLLYRPIADGADIVVHSMTKYISGHADVVGGIAVFADEAVHREVLHQGIEYGATPDPFAAWLAVRGLGTLAVRMRSHCENAATLADRLSEHPAVSAVHYPGLPSHPGHDMARKLLSGGYGGVLAFDLDGGEAAAEAFVGALRLASLSGSLGSTRTLVMPPARTSHRQLDSEALARSGIGPGTVRLAVGIEHVEDLWADIAGALAATATEALP